MEFRLFATMRRENQVVQDRRRIVHDNTVVSGPVTRTSRIPRDFVDPIAFSGGSKHIAASRVTRADGVSPHLSCSVTPPNITWSPMGLFVRQNTSIPIRKWSSMLQ